MDEKILIVIALILFACIIAYNAFFIPRISLPANVYVDNNSKNDVITYKDNNEDENIIDSSNENDDKININTATADELCTLPGIGPSLSNRIIDYRETVGEFNSIYDIMDVNGIGEKIFANIEDSICV